MCKYVYWVVMINLLSFEEANVEEGGIEVDKLEQIHFESERVFVFSISPMKLYIVTAQ